MNFKNRVLYLAEIEEDLNKLTSKEIYNIGKKQKDFDHKKGLNILIKRSKNGYFIHLAGKYWKNFDYEKGLDALIKKDKKGNRIEDAGIYWARFDYEKGLSALMEINSFHDIYMAGIYWRNFNYDKAFEYLKKKNEFHYKKALTKWPKNIKQSLAKSKRIKNKAKQMPKSKKYEL